MMKKIDKIIINSDDGKIGWCHIGIIFKIDQISGVIILESSIYLYAHA